jgi:hypothetical protein
MLNITEWLNGENVEVTGIIELEKQVYNQVYFATSWGYEVWLFSWSF